MKNIPGLIILGLCLFTGQAIALEKAYVAVEGEGKLAVIDTHTAKVLKTIDISERTAGESTPYAPHNVQVAPDGHSVWVTAMAGGHAGAAEHGEHHAATPADQIIVIDPISDTLIKRIAMAPNLHLAHVVLTPDSRYAYVTAQDEDSLYKIDARSYRVEKRIALPAQSHPHGLRISPNDGHAYIALLTGKGLAVLNLTDDTLNIHSLPGAAVQTAVSPDGSLVFASLYDSKRIAVFNPKSGSLGYMNLPEGSKGPVQIYPSADGRMLWVADQGHYFGQPANHLVYKLDSASGAVLAQISAGHAPHGVVAAPKSGLVYVTNLLSGDVSVIDAQRNIELSRIPVGEKPNGISLWSSEYGGTP